ncbi:unnamed protein product [Effrenium voratum]|nr:unnamed protein product [Effrenium voratum]
MDLDAPSPLPNRFNRLGSAIGLPSSASFAGFGQMARVKVLSKVLLAAAAASLLRWSTCFAAPRREAAAALAAAMVAANTAPAMAEVPTFSFFGLGSGQSDAYSQNDNPINPYSQFSDGSETVYKARNPDEVDRRKKALTAALTRFENTPEYIKTKQAQALKGNLLQAGGSMKQDMIYFSGEEGSAAYAKAREFSQKVSTLGVDGGNKQWAAAAQDYEKAAAILSEWKQLAQF